MLKMSSKATASISTITDNIGSPHECPWPQAVKLVMRRISELVLPVGAPSGVFSSALRRYGFAVLAVCACVRCRCEALRLLLWLCGSCGCCVFNVPVRRETDQKVVLVFCVIKAFARPVSQSSIPTTERQ
jgi:hypothetical protein